MKARFLGAFAAASALGIAATAAELQRGRLMRAPDHDGAFPTWAYGPDGQSGIFHTAEEIPTGWQDHPSKVKGAAPAPEGVKTARTSANGSVSEARVAKSTTAQSDTIVDPAKTAQVGVGGMGATAPTGDTASKLDKGTTAPEVDAQGHVYDPKLHAGTGSKTKEGLWRMKVGVKRPAPITAPLDL